MAGLVRVSASDPSRYVDHLALEGKMLTLCGQPVLSGSPDDGLGSYGECGLCWALAEGPVGVDGWGDEGV